MLTLIFLWSNKSFLSLFSQRREEILCEAAGGDVQVPAVLEMLALRPDQSPMEKHTQ